MTKSKPGFIRRFFGGLFGAISWLRNAFFNLIFLFLVLIIVASLAPKDPLTLPAETSLRIAPQGYLVDQYSYQPPFETLMGSPAVIETLTHDLISAINRASDDPRVTSLVLDLNQLAGGGISKLQEVGNAIERFKAEGKPVYVTSDFYTQQQYYLATYADMIPLHPMGGVLISGYGSYRNYFKDSLEKLAINFHVFKVGTYKDAIEPFTQNKMSDASREHNALWLDNLWSRYGDHIETQRELEAGAINHYVDNLDNTMRTFKGDSAAVALELGLVDQLMTAEQQQQWLASEVGSGDDYGYQAVDYDQYLALTDLEQTKHSEKIGVVVASGTIVDGEQPEGSIGGDSFSALIKDARERDDIKALVVRIDSGGGSAFASEVIRDELAKTREQGIPVFISMGSVAASGGYWMATASDEIWATPETITGSIGVFSAFPTLEDSLEKLGVHTDGVGTTSLAGAMRPDMPLSDSVKTLLQQSVNHIYSRFIGLVAEARGQTPEAIDQIAQGRVWSAEDALEHGLVDQLGDLSDTIEAAAMAASLDEFSVEWIERELSPQEQFFKELNQQFGHVKFDRENQLITRLTALLEVTFPPLMTLSPTADPRQIYAQCVGCDAP